MTEHERRVLGLIRENPEVVADKKARRELASRMGLSEKTLRNRIADFKRYGLIDKKSLKMPKEGTPVEVGRDFSVENATRLGYVGQPRLRGSDSDLFAYIRYVVKWRKVFIRNLLVVSVIAVVVSFLMPKTFEATAILMPPSEEGSGGLLERLTNLPFSGFPGQPQTSETMTLLAILKSRTMMEKVVDTHGLVGYYHVENVEDAVEKLERYVSFEVEDEGTIRIITQFETGWLSSDEDQEFASLIVAKMANTFVSEVDRRNKELKTEKARFQRMFIEERYRQNMKDLAVAEDKLKEFQENHGTIALPEQTAAAIEAAATLKAQLIAKQVKLNVMARTVNPDHPEIERTREEIVQLSSQLERMEKGSKQDALFPIFSDVPDLAVQLARLTREVEIQNTLFTFLTQQHEEAKIREAKDTPTVQVLDAAIAPEKPAGPRKLFIVLSAFLGGFLLTLLYIGLKERFRFSQ